MSNLWDNLKARKDEKDLARFEYLSIMMAGRQASTISLPVPALERYNELQYKIWYQASCASDLLRFYSTVREPWEWYGTKNKFYIAAKGSDVPFSHYSLAQVITKTMQDLIFGKDIAYKASSGNKAKDADYQKALDSFFSDNDKMGFLRQCAALESYSGAVGIKFVLDPSVSEFPIMQAYPKEEVEVRRKYGRIVEIAFKDYYAIQNDPAASLVLKTICGKGYIRYQAQREVVSPGLLQKSITEAKLSDIPEAAGLHDTYFFNKDGSASDRIFAIYKENKDEARSDYYEVTDDFQNIDEIYTNLMDCVRKSKIKTYLHDNVLTKAKINGQQVSEIPSAYDTSNIAIPDNNPNWAQTDIKRDVVQVQPLFAGYAEAFRHVLETALATAGLSINTVSSSDMDADYQNTMAVSSKEKSSLRTREEKISRWKAAIADMCSIAIALMGASGDGDITLADDPDPKEFLAIFPDYEETPIKDKIALIVEKLNAGLMTREQAVRDLYPDMTDDQRAELLAKLEAEKADRQAPSSQANPSDTSGTKQIVGIAAKK